MVSSKDTIIIATLNEETYMRGCLESILAYTSPDLVDVVLVDGGSSDRTVDIAREYDNVSAVMAKGSLIGEARNIGMSQCNANTYVFLDADTEITEHWYTEMKKSLQVFDIVGGFSPCPNKNVRMMPRVPIYVSGQDITLPGCNLAYKKSVIDHIGVFRTDLKSAEDCDLNYRAVIAGYTIGYNPHMLIYHYPRSTRKGFLKQSYRNGFGRHQLNMSHPELTHSHYHGMELRNGVRLAMGLLGLLSGRLSKPIS